MNFHDCAALIFWISGALLFFTFAGYGLLIALLARLRNRPLSTPPRDAPAPTVEVALSAFDEEAGIADRLRNLFASDYPAQKLRVLLVSDGSADATVARARALGESRLTILEHRARAGKAAALNAALARCTAEVVVFADARQRFASDAIARLAAHFADPTIGAVSGALEITPAASATGAGVDAYWRYEKALRAAEARFDSCIGCTGAIYAIRRALYTPLPADTLLDDVVVPMQIAARGARVIHDPAARAFEPQPLEPSAERRRKARTIAGNFQLLFRHPAWLLPWRHRLWWQLLAHKYLRLLAPALLVANYSANLVLAAHPFYAACLAAQAALYACAALGTLPRAGRWRILALPAAFIFLNLQTIRGFRQFLRGANRIGWR